jgi:hypothetical protein
VSEAFDTVVAFLQGDGWPVAVRTDGGEIVATKFEGAAGIWICEGRVDAHQRFVFYSVAPALVPESRRAAVAEYLTRVNAGLVVGNFELDLDGGAVRMKTSLDFEGEPLSPTLIRNLVYANVRAMDHYAPGLVAVSDGHEPADAIARLDSG